MPPAALHEETTWGEPFNIEATRGVRSSDAWLARGWATSDAWSSPWKRAGELR